MMAERYCCSVGLLSFESFCWYQFSESVCDDKEVADADFCAGEGSQMIDYYEVEWFHDWKYLEDFRVLAQPALNVCIWYPVSDCKSDTS